MDHLNFWPLVLGPTLIYRLHARWHEEDLILQILLWLMVGKNENKQKNLCKYVFHGRQIILFIHTVWKTLYKLARLHVLP